MDTFDSSAKKIRHNYKYQIKPHRLYCHIHPGNYRAKEQPFVGQNKSKSCESTHESGIHYTSPIREQLHPHSGGHEHAGLTLTDLPPPLLQQ